MLAINSLLISMMVLIPSIISTLTIVLKKPTPSQPSTLEKLSNGDYQFFTKSIPMMGEMGRVSALTL